VSKIRDVTMMSWLMERNASSFGAFLPGTKVYVPARRGGQLALFDITPDSRNAPFVVRCAQSRVYVV